jgi:soluble lytic murein transglycosylase
LLRGTGIFLVLIIFTGGTAAASAVPKHKSHRHNKVVHHDKLRKAERTAGPRLRIEASAPLSRDDDLARQAITAIRHGQFADAKATASSIGDRVAQKLVEWVLLRHPDCTLGFERYDSFIQANPGWPSIPLLRRRAETRLWQAPRDAATVRRFVESHPASALGRLTLARMELKAGDRTGAARDVRAVWRSAEMSAEMESRLAEMFGDELTRADHVVRMDRRIGAKDFGGAMRAAKRLGDAQVAIVKACQAARSNAKRGRELLQSVPKEARSDLGYALCRLHLLVARDDLPAAADVVLGAAPADLQLQDTNEWWREIRLLVRKLIDRDDSKTAYRVTRHAAVPANPYYRAEYHFMAGWIALRFLNDPAAASEHFAHIDDGTADPIVLARGAYWRGRAAEAAGRKDEMLNHYDAAARYPTAYYGQLARARLGINKSAPVLRPQPEQQDNTELPRAAEILYAIGEYDLALAFVSDLAETSTDIAALDGVARVTARYKDAQAMLILGKTALARGLPMEAYAFPKIGVPDYKPIAPPLDQSIAFSIVRTESGFDQRDMSPAKAVGLMQVTPEAGRDTAKRFGVSYDWTRLVNDPVYNMQMGAAELSALLKEYTGSYILTFAGYNAGRGRVKEWVAKHGDPRDPKIDPVDWVERIPLAETRNYVQRVMENVHVYRVIFDRPVATIEPNLYRASVADTGAAPESFMQAMP